MEVCLDPGIVRDLSGLVKGTVNIARDDGRVELVKLNVVFLGVGFVHENSSYSCVKEDWGFDNSISFCGFALKMGKVMHHAHRIATHFSY